MVVSKQKKGDNQGTAKGEM